MTWFKVDDATPTDPRVLKIPRCERLACMGLWMLAGAWSSKHLTDGRIPAYMLEELGADMSHGTTLVTVGLWAQGDDEFMFVDWSEAQQVKVDVLANRERERRRKEEYRARRAGNTGKSPASVPDSVPEGQKRVSGHPFPPSIPTPDLTSPSPSSDEAEKKRSDRRPEIPLPTDWSPTDAHRLKAQDAGIDLQAAVEAFRDHAETHDRRAVSWNAAFTAWLKRAPSPTTEADFATGDEWMEFNR